MNAQILPRLPATRTLVVWLLLVVLAGWASLEVWQRHQRAQALLDQLEPRYARMVGMKDGGAETDMAIDAARALLQRHAYPAVQDVSQVGNAVQQRLREMASAAALDVVSSQILPAKSGQAFDRIALALRVEGQIAGLQTLFAGLQGSAPSIWLESFTVQPMGTPRADAPQRLSVALNFVVLRAKE